MIEHVEFKNDETNTWKRNELREIVVRKSAKFGKFRLTAKGNHLTFPIALTQNRF